MRAAVLYKALDMRVEELPEPRPATGEALVRVKSVGICGSDFHYWKNGRVGSYVVEAPLILGHELSGVVEELGPGPSSFAPGDRVVVEPGVPCRRCAYCKQGRYNLCGEMRFMATPPVNGAFAEYVAVPQDFLHRLPERMTFEEGAMVEPLAVGIHAAKRAPITLGATVAVMGAGPIGLLAGEAARASGAGEVYVVDIDPWRLEKAKGAGASRVLNPLEEDVVEALRDLTGGEGVDVAIEASGSAVAMAQALEAVKRGGSVVLIGLYAERTVPAPLLGVIERELDIKGVFRYANVFPAAVQAINSGRVNVGRLITHRLPLEEVERGFRLIDAKRENVLKILVLP